MNNIFLKKSITNPETVILRPFFYTKPSVRASVLGQIFLIFLQLCVLFFTKSYSALLVIGFAVLATIASEFVNIKKYKRHHDSLAICIVQGLFVGMFLPETFPLLAVFCITFFTFVLIKNSFVSFSGAWANPVAVTVAIAYFTASTYFPVFSLDKNIIQNVNIGTYLYQNEILTALPMDFSLTTLINEKILSKFGISIPTGYLTLLLDNGFSIPAFRFNLLTILSSIILFSMDMVIAIIPIASVLTYLLFVRIAGFFILGGEFLQGDMLLALCTSGVLFCSLFLLPWYGTIPYTKSGRIFYGIICGVIFYVIVGCAFSAAGCVFSVLIANVLSPFIQMLENRRINNDVSQMMEVCNAE